MLLEPSESLKERISNPEGEEPDVVESRFLIFSLGSELYGAPLIGIKEVIKCGEINPVPYMASHFRGVINLRGQIIGVVDFRSRFGFTDENTCKGLILVTESEGRVMGVIVDDVISVAAILPAAIERNPSLITNVPIDFFLGIGKHDGRLVNLIALGACLTHDDYATTERNRKPL